MTAPFCMGFGTREERFCFDAQKIQNHGFTEGRRRLTIRFQCHKMKKDQGWKSFQ